jgi:four helix bundle protein
MSEGGWTMAGKPHKRLEAWRQSMDLVVMIYQVTARFPAEERFGLVSQIRRAAVSVPSNVAEGAARGSSRFFTSALQIARASLSELDTQIIIAHRLGYLSDREVSGLTACVEEIERIVNGLISSVRRRLAAGVVASALAIALGLL